MSCKSFPQLSETELEKLIFEGTQYGLSSGLLMYPQPYENYEPVLAPVTLYPTPFPRQQFEKALKIAKSYNKLYSNIVIEKKWLHSILKKLSLHDAAFTGKLYECFLKAEKVGIPQDVSLALIRSDYMYDEISNNIKQVEFNTVSVSFGGLSSKVGELHNFLNNTGRYGSNGELYYSPKDLPVSKSFSSLANGLYSGVKYYNDKYLDGQKNSIVLFVVQPNERNAFDQRAIEYSLLKQHGIISKRIDLPEVSRLVKIGKTNKKLYFEGKEVSVVYYRSAYGPAEFDCQEAWDCRVLLETSLAIKCPSLLTQLSGVKKVQQLLTDDEVLSKFINEDSDSEDLKSTFCKIYPFDDTENGKIAKKIAFEQPENFVVKPQREGGGNNIYKEDIPKFLRSLPEEEWEGYILMELINPATHDNVILRNGKLLTEGIVSELGIFGSFLMNERTGELISNECCGHLLRSKTSSSNEGGVAAGYGCVDNLYLY